MIKPPPTQSYRANGKFLLNSEYLVLDGAQGICLPLNLGQTLRICPQPTNTIIWHSLTQHGNHWFEAHYDHNLDILSTTNHTIATTLQTLLRICTHHNPTFSPLGIQATTNLEFDTQWGLGSSSTLISLLGQWSRVDPYTILDQGFGGSGYDIAAATQPHPFLFTLKDNSRQLTPLTFSPKYSEELFFIYSGNKQSSHHSISPYRHIPLAIRLLAIHKADQITHRILHSTTLSDFEQCLIDHEQLLGELLNRETLSQKFADYTHGAIKSLGAWGGDFFLATGKQAPKYFTDKGYNTIIKFNDIVCK